MPQHTQMCKMCRWSSGKKECPKKTRDKPAKWDNCGGDYLPIIVLLQADPTRNKNNANNSKTGETVPPTLPATSIVSTTNISATTANSTPQPNPDKTLRQCNQDTDPD